MNLVRSFIRSYPSIPALVGAVVCTAAASEMALSVLNDLPHLADLQSSKLESFSCNLGGTFFYSLCAINCVPYSAALGGAIFCVHSLAVYESSQAYYTSQVIGRLVNFAWDNAVSPLWNQAVYPLVKWSVKSVIVPLGNKISEIFSIIFKSVQLPHAPVWYGVAFMVVAIAASKGLARMR